MDRLIKSALGAEVTNEAKGEVTAVFCTYGVKDKDGDVIVKGAIKDGHPVVISAYNHKSWDGAMPVGKGIIRDTGNEAVLEGKFFMETTHGRDAFHTVKALAEDGLGEWSWGFKADESEMGELDGEQVKFIKATSTFEVSPVLMGAGVNTRTLAVKSVDEEVEAYLKRTFTQAERDKDADSGKALPDGSFPIENEKDLRNAIRAIGRAKDPDKARRHIVRRARALGLTDLLPDDWKGKKFADEGAEVLAFVTDYRHRAAEVLAMRQEKGKGLSDDSLEILTTLRDELSEIERMLTESKSDSDDPANDAQKAYLRMIAVKNNINGDN